MVKWFNYNTFDFIGDLAFGESLGCLEQAKLHWAIAFVFDSIKLFPWLQATLWYGIYPYINYIAPKELLEANEMTAALAASKVDQRLEETKDRKDFLSYIVAHKTGKDVIPMTREELHANAWILLIAGSD